MGLLTPSGGLLFWMTLAFAVVFFVLVKFAFPAILGSVKKREEYIDAQLDAAKVAEARLEGINAEGERILAEAERQKVEILKDAASNRVQILSEAKEKAGEEAARILAEAKRQAEQEKEAILASARGEVAMIAVQMASKVLRGQLSEEKAQQALQEAFADEAAHKA